MPTTFPKDYLPSDSAKWGRAVQGAIIAAERAIDSIVNRGENSGSSQTGTLGRLAQQVASLTDANTQLANTVAQLTDASQTFGGSQTINRSVGATAWLTGVRPQATLASRSGRIEINLSGSLNNGGGYIVVSVDAADGTKSYLSRESMQGNFGIRIALQGGASFMPSGSTNIVVNVDPNVPVLIVTQVYGDTGGCYVGGLNLLARPAL